MRDSVLEATLIGSRHEDRHDHDVFSGISLTLGPGDVACIVGENGSGKSSLLRTLGGKAERAGGDVRWCGQPGRQDVFLVCQKQITQSAIVTAAVTVGEVVLSYALHVGLAQHAMNRFGIDRTQSIRTLSTGSLQRLTLALASVNPAWAYLFDGPTMGLDASGRDLLEDLIQELADQGAGVLVATNDIDLVGRLDRSALYRLEDGSLNLLRPVAPRVHRQASEPSVFPASTAF